MLLKYLSKIERKLIFLFSDWGPKYGNTIYLTLTWAGRGQFCVSRFVKNLKIKVAIYKIRTKSVRPKIIFQKYKFIVHIKMVATDTISSKK